MVELIFIFVVSITVGRIAEMDGGNAFIWGAITFVLSFFFVALPFPYLRIVAAGFATGALMVVVKTIRGR